MTDVKPFKSQRKEKIEKKSRKFTFIVVIATIIGVLFTLTLAVLTVQAYSFRSPIILQNPFVLRINSPKAAKPTIKPLPKVTPISSTHTYQYEDIINKIAVLESGNGTATTGHSVYCAEQGKINIWGYGNRQGLCFDDRDAGMNTLSIWIGKRINQDRMTMGQTLCYYNTGLKMEDCPYYQSFLSLK